MGGKEWFNTVPSFDSYISEYFSEYFSEEYFLTEYFSADNNGVGRTAILQLPLISSTHEERPTKGGRLKPLEEPGGGFDSELRFILVYFSIF